MFISATTTLSLLLSLQYMNVCAGDQIPLQSHHDTPGPILDDDFAEWIQKLGAEWGMKGIAIAVTRKNRDGSGWTTETKGYGVADRWANPVDDETLFSIGSNSKLFTALGVGMLTANESLPVKWDTKIKDILPRSVWALQDTVAQENANLVDILSHRTGLPRHDLSYSKTDTPASAVAKLRYLRPSAEFRETFQYNNQMYVLADHIIVRLTGMLFGEYMTRNIFAPLCLTSTTYNVTQADQSGKLADGFVAATKGQEKGEKFQARHLKPIPFWSKAGGTRLNAGAGGIISNAKDMATWLQTLLLSGRSPATGDEIIPASVVNKVGQGVTVAGPQAPFPELSPSVYGMGLLRHTYQGHELIEHEGGTIGHYSVVTRCPNDDLGVAVLTNWEGGSLFMQLVKWRLLEKALGLKEVDWSGRYHGLREQAVLANVTRRTPRPLGGTPSTLPHYDLAGLYFNPAYGAVSLCAYPLPNHIQPFRKECEGVFSEALKPFLNDSVPTLVAAWPKLWSSHLLLQHFSGDRFDVLPVYAFPPPFPNAPKSDDNSRPFAIPSGSAVAEFVFGKGEGDDSKHIEGIACGGAWGAGEGVEDPKGKGREGAQVWFDRVA